MDIGTNLWKRRVDNIAREMGENLDLERTVVTQRASELQADAHKLARQRAFLREERRRARMEEKLLRQDVSDLESLAREDWIPTRYLPQPGEKRLRLNIGGQMFEASAVFFRRDPHCLLAALCEEGGPLTMNRDEIVYVDRDWWMFRHVIKFLRDGFLPIGAAVLAQLYREAEYWRCEILKRAIEEEIHLYRSRFKSDSSGANHRKGRGIKVNLTAQSKDAKKKVETKDTSDWWTGSDYRGRNYAILDADELPAEY